MTLPNARLVRQVNFDEYLIFLSLQSNFWNEGRVYKDSAMISKPLAYA
jgi:hypothetical protein